MKADICLSQYAKISVCSTSAPDDRLLQELYLFEEACIVSNTLRMHDFCFKIRLIISWWLKFILFVVVTWILNSQKLKGHIF